jgi:hypothetical protein
MAYGKILVVEGPAVKLREEGRNLGWVRTNHPKISQLTLAAIIRKEFPEVDVRIIDMKSADPSKETKVKEINYGDRIIEVYAVGQDFAGIEREVRDADAMICTCNSTQEAGVIGDLIGFAKKINSRIRVFVGGTDAGVGKEWGDRQTYFYSRQADYVASHGDGEITLPLLLRGKPVPDSRAARTLSDLDNVPDLPFDLVDLGRYYEPNEGPLPEGVRPPLMYMETSRGCRNSCDFCSTPFAKGGYRFMSQRRIEEWLRLCKNAGIATILVMEDSVLSRLDFPEGRQAVIDLFVHMRSEGFAWEFANGIEIGKLAPAGRIDEELIEAMFSFDGFSGCYRSYIPFERVDIQAYKKLKPFDVNKAILGSIVKRKVRLLTAGVIIGHPNETLESLAQTRRKLKELRKVVGDISGGETLITMAIFVHTPIPGTSDFRRFRREGRLAFDIDEHPELYGCGTSVVNGFHLTYPDITTARRDIALEVNGEEAMISWETSGKYKFVR